MSITLDSKGGVRPSLRPTCAGHSRYSPASQQFRRAKEAPKKHEKPKDNKPDQNKDRDRDRDDDSRREKDPEPAKPRCHSFDPSTRVLMANGGTRPIMDVNVGDEVVTTDPVTGEHSDQQVTLLHVNVDVELTDVTVSSRPADNDARPVGEGDGERGTRGPPSSVLYTTANHPFWDATTGEWVVAAELVPGESTLVGPDGQIQYVTGVRNFTGAKTMRDLTVANVHTYYVIAGDQPVLVHNNNNCGNQPADPMADEPYGPARENGVRPHKLNREEKDLLREEARDIWETTTGRRAIWDNLQVHHRIPLEWAHMMPGNPNRLANLVGMRSADHNQVTQAWNAWKRGLNGVAPSQADIMRTALDIDRRFGQLMVFPK